MTLDTDQTLLAGRYRRLRTLGTGGMARVHLAEDERLGRRVAVKQMHSAAPEDSARRFQREARLGASLGHPNVVYVFDVEADGESVLIVMEYVEGRTLGEELVDGPLDTARAVSVICDLGAALDHIHSHGVVHRDVKPANVLIATDGTAKLTDLGIATAAESTRITRSGTVLGSAAYMAPEQLAGEQAGPAADVYSFAALAFEALSGRKARQGTTPVEIAHRVATELPPDLREAWPGAPAGAAEALRRGMAAAPEDRFGSAGELAEAVRRGLEEGRTAPTLLAPRTAGPRAPRWLPAAAAIAALALVGAVALLALGGRDGGGGDQGRSEPARQQPQRSEPESPREQPAPAPAPAPADEEPTRPASSPGELNDRGFELMNQGRYDEAIPLLQRAVDSYGSGSQDLTYAYALFNLGRALREAGRPDEAVAVLERRLQIPNQTKAVEKELKKARKAAK